MARRNLRVFVAKVGIVPILMKRGRRTLIRACKMTDRGCFTITNCNGGDKRFAMTLADIRVTKRMDITVTEMGAFATDGDLGVTDRFIDIKRLCGERT